MRSGGGVTAGAARSRRGDAVRVKQLATVVGDGAAYARGAAPGGGGGGGAASARGAAYSGWRRRRGIRTGSAPWWTA